MASCQTLTSADSGFYLAL